MINQFKEYERNEMQNGSKISNKNENIFTKRMKKIDQKIKSYIVIISDVMLSLLCICILYFLRYKQFDLYSFLISYIYMYLEVKSRTCMYMYFLTSKH